MKILLPQQYLLIFSAGFVLSVLLTPLMRRLALATGQVAAPKNTRWHKKETALMGGVGIYVSTVAVWIASTLFMEGGIPRTPFLPLFLCATGIFGLGLADDIFNMDPQQKLVVQFAVASILMVFGFRLGWTGDRTVNLFITVIWIVGITNAFNLLDNMDGLAAGVAFIAAIFIFFSNYIHPGGVFAGVVLMMSAAYLGALLGFLIYNFNPASIFMGDAGSLFIGFVIACFTVLGGEGQSAGGGAGKLLSVIAIPILIVFIPILDTGFVSLMRKLFKRPISQGGRDHSSHRMVAIGFSEKRAVLTIYAFAAGSGLIALAINYLSIGSTLVITALYLLFVVFFWVYLAKVKVYEGGSILERNGLGPLTPILVQITYRRRLFEVLLDFVLVSVAYYASYLLRFEGTVYYLIGADFDFFLRSWPILAACQILSLHVFGVYRGVWESTSLSDLLDYVKAITAGTVSTMLILLFLYRFQSFSRAVFIIYWVLMLVLVSLSRLSFRLVDEWTKKEKQRGGKPVLIYGAGVGGQVVMKEIEKNNNLGLVLVGFIDDDPKKQKRKIMGYSVLGGREDLDRIIRKNDIREVIVSFRQNGNRIKSDLDFLCRKLGKEIRISQLKLTIE